MLSPKGLGSRSQNMDGAYKSMQSMNPAKMFEELKAKTSGGGLNLNEISKDISTTVSGGGSSTVKVPDMAEMTKKFETSFAEFDKVAIKNIKFDDLSSSFKTSFDDFGSEISNYADLNDLMSPFEESFSSFNNDFESMIVSSSEDIADAMGGSKASAAQAKIDDAIAEKQKALDKITYMLNEVSDEDFDQSAWDEAIAERDAAQEKLDRVIEESISDLAGGFDDFSDNWEESLDKVSADITDAIPYDEFGGLDEAIARNQADDKQRAKATSGAMQEVVTGSSPAKLDRGITTDSFTLGPNGLPIAKPKSTAAAVPEKKNEGKTAEEQVKEREEQAKADMAKDSKGATLDDLLKSMNALNTKVGQLISVNEDGHKASAKAAKSNNANLYTR